MNKKGLRLPTEEQAKETAEEIKAELKELTKEFTVIEWLMIAGVFLMPLLIGIVLGINMHDELIELMSRTKGMR